MSTTIYRGLYGHVLKTYLDGSIQTYISNPNGIGWILYLTKTEFQYKRS